MNRRYPQLRVPPPPRAGSVGYSPISIGKMPATTHECNTGTMHSSDQSCDLKEIAPPKPPRQGTFRFEDDPTLSSTFLKSTSDNDQVSLQSSAEDSDISDNAVVGRVKSMSICHEENTLSNQMVNFLIPKAVDEEHQSLSDYSERPHSIYENLESVTSSTAKEVLCLNDDTRSRQTSSSDSYDLFSSDSESDSTEPQSDSATLRPPVCSVQRPAPPKPFRPTSVSINDILEYKEPSQIFAKSPQPSAEMADKHDSDDAIYDVLPDQVPTKSKPDNLSGSFVKLRRAKVELVEPGSDPLTAVSRPFSVCIPQAAFANFPRSQSFSSSSSSEPNPYTRTHSTSTPNVNESIVSKFKRAQISPLWLKPTNEPRPTSRFYLQDNLEVPLPLPDTSKVSDGTPTRKLSDTVNRYKQALVENLTPAVFSIPQPTKSTFFVDQSIENTETEEIYYGDSTISISNRGLSAASSISDSLRFGSRIYETPNTRTLTGDCDDEDSSGYYCYADTEKPRWINTTTESISGPSGRPAPPSLPEPDLTSDEASSASSSDHELSVSRPVPRHNKLIRLSVSDHSRRKTVVSVQFSEEFIPIKSHEIEYANIQNR